MKNIISKRNKMYNPFIRCLEDHRRLKDIRGTLVSSLNRIREDVKSWVMLQTGKHP